MSRVLIGNIKTVLAAFSLEGRPLQQSLAVAEMSAIRPVYPRTAAEQAAQGALLDFSKVPQADILPLSRQACGPYPADLIGAALLPNFGVSTQRN
jgi:hypothetical protein